MFSNYFQFLYSLFQLHNAQVRAALGLSQVDEALYLQRQQELQRDFQIRQMLLQEQIDQQTRLDSMLHEQQLKAIGEHLQEFPDLQQHYRSLLLNEQLQRQEEGLMLRERAQLQQQEEMRRRHLATQQQAQAKPAAIPSAPQPPKSVQSNAAATAARFRDIAADSLAGNAVKRSELEKRQFAKPDDDILPTKQRKKERTTSEDDGERKPKHKNKHHKKHPPQQQQAQQPTQKAPPSPQEESTVMEFEEESTMKPSALALLDFASSTPEPPALPVFVSPPPEVITPLGTVADLLTAANSEEKADDAADALVGIKKHVEWSDDSEQEEDDPVIDYTIAIKKGEAINLPGFMSVLPQLPEEPQVKMPVSKKKKKRKHKGLLDDDSIDEKTNGKSKSHKHEQKDAKTSEAKAAELNVVEYPYPIDTWWPSVSSVKRERKAAGEPQDEDAFTEEPQILSEDSQFRAHAAKIIDNFANEVEPGVLEKIPHCKIHRMLMKKRKNPSAPELVYCWQVTELYPNDIMTCCTHCGTWRHAACGGHHTPYSVRDGIHSPFTAVCDRCCDEEKVLRNHPLARKRIDRQRTEQIRRGLATSACMRQASFSKHGGTYKWPLGSVSATHIGGHTRSVHSRHDKAEKQWTDMATRLGRGYGYRPKERVKVRTKELERLLVSVEDAGKKRMEISILRVCSVAYNFVFLHRGPHGSSQHDALSSSRY
jgi:hypothetical protein